LSIQSSAAHLHSLQAATNGVHPLAAPLIPGLREKDFPDPAMAGIAQGERMQKFK
jgi:hypothetical protein